MRAVSGWDASQQMMRGIFTSFFARMVFNRWYLIYLATIHRMTKHFKHDRTAGDFSSGVLFQIWSVDTLLE